MYLKISDHITFYKNMNWGISNDCLDLEFVAPSAV